MTRHLHDSPLGTPVLVAGVLVVAVAAHAGAWYFISHHLGLSGALASVLVAIAVLEHLGWVGGAVPFKATAVGQPSSPGRGPSSSADRLRRNPVFGRSMLNQAGS